MEVGEIAYKKYVDGFNCGESILSALIEKGILKDSGDVVRCATGFGGGIGHTGDICGCIPAGVIAIGIKFGRTAKDQSPDIALEKCEKLYKLFQNKFKDLHCKTLTKAWRDKGAFKTPERRKYCASIVRFMAEETAKLLA